MADPWTGDVPLVFWPDEPERLRELTAARIPRVVLHDHQTTPTQPPDTLELWIQITGDLDQLRHRVHILQQAAASSSQPPSLDEYGLLRLGKRIVALSPTEERLARELLDHFGSLVPRRDLINAAWPAGTTSQTGLRVHIGRLRQRIKPLGLDIQAVKRRGYLIQRRFLHD